LGVGFFVLAGGISRHGTSGSVRGLREALAVKLVVAIVRPEKANDVLEALYRAEVRGLSITRVQGHGGETDRVETYRGTTVKMELSEKVRFEIGVSDNFVEPTVRAIQEGARTGEVGDGKIFVLPVEKVIRIRTGEEDTAAVTPVE
jgi:nitrogen regulatory protein P-II 1